MSKFASGAYYAKSPITVDGTTTVALMAMPEGVDDICLITVGAATATGTLEMTYSSPDEVAAGTAVWVAVPQTHTIANGVVKSNLVDTGPPVYQPTPTAFRVTRTGGTISLRISGKYRN